jgi:hypothetical protein
MRSAQVVKMIIGIFPENFRKKSGPKEPLRERRIRMKKFTLLPSFFIGLKSKDFKKVWAVLSPEPPSKG